ncbi:glycosyl transferase GltA [Micromonospora sp. ATCC 39149]|uniref:Glycosyltransferase n=1 Tax=Micromonospora carbonacea TaxID=47853 RepID=A0A7D6GRF3_9ACTN|nr:glycosyl transferase GltA [Micromonospora sp. ATCC 39149]QLK01111.1 glycosyltransferase [Micromonospora carbonacea]
MTQLVSVITPVHAPSIQYLAGAYASLAKQDMPPGWDWQWLVQEDGQTGALVDALLDDPRISLGTGRPGGPGVARTLALSRVSGQLIKVLDADDQLTPGALARDIAAFDAHPQIGWTTSRVLDLLPDGSTAGWDKDPAGGVIDRGSVLSFWQANDYRASVHPATLCLRRDLVFALGGWMALPASEDTGLLLAANAVSEGYFTREYGLLYRKWPGQVTSQAAHREPAEYQARMRIIEARANALASMVPNGFGFGGATA